MAKTIRMRKSEAEEILGPTYERALIKAQKLKDEISEKYRQKCQKLKKEIRDLIIESILHEPDLSKIIVEESTEIDYRFKRDKNKLDLEIYTSGLMHITKETSTILDKLPEDKKKKLEKYKKQIIKVMKKENEERTKITRNLEAWRDRTILNLMKTCSYDVIEPFDPKKDYISKPKKAKP